MNPQTPVKLRFKLPSGIEFEAEGPLEFVTKERENLIILAELQGKTPSVLPKNGGDKQIFSHALPPTVQEKGTLPPVSTGTNTATVSPKYYSRHEPEPPRPEASNRGSISEFETSARPVSAAEDTPDRGYKYIVPEVTKPAIRPATLPKSEPQDSPTLFTPIPQYPQNEPGATATTVLWDKITQIKDNLAILKARPAGLEANDCALLLLAASRILLNRPSQTALELAKAVRKSGYIKGRLDRILQTEITQGRIASVGTKRGRQYNLTGAGLARASRMAEQIAAAGS